MLRQPRPLIPFAQGALGAWIPALPTGLAPVDGYATPDTTPLFDWNPVYARGTITYSFQLTTNADTGFAAPLVDVTGLTNSDYTPTALALGVYRWRVKAINASGDSGWTTPITVDIDDPLVEFIEKQSDLLVSWFAKRSDALLVAAKNPYVAESRNLVINGDFATDTIWTKGAGWTIAGGVAHNDGTAGSPVLSQAAPTVVGKWYKVTYTISNYVSGNIRVALTGGAGFSPNASANGTYTYFLSPGTGTQLILFAPNTTFIGDIDNVTLQQVNIRESSIYPRLDIVTNGAFNFDYGFTGTNWAVVSGKLVHTPGSTVNAAQTVASTVIGKSYDLTFTVSDRTAGQVIGKVGTTGGATARTTNATFTETIVAAGTAGIYFTPDSAFDGKIDVVSCVPNDGLLAYNGDGSTTTGWTATNSATLSSVAGWLRVARNGTNAPGATQSMAIIGRRYRIQADCRGDGSAVSPVFRDGTAVLFTGTVSGSTQTLDVVVLATAVNNFRFGNDATSGTSYAEWDNIVITEINPLDGLLVGPALNASAEAALGGKSWVFDATNDFINIYSAELNSIIDPALIWQVGFAKLGSGALADGVVRYISRVAVGGNDQLLLRKSATNNTLTALSSGAADTETFDVATTTALPFMLGNAVSTAVPEASASYNGVSQGVSVTPTAMVGNLASTTCLLGALSTAGANCWNDVIYGMALFKAYPTDARRLKMAQLGGTA